MTGYRVAVVGGYRCGRLHHAPPYAERDHCARVVVINYPPQSSTGGTIITSYGAVVGEPGSDLPSQG